MSRNDKSTPIQNYHIHGGIEHTAQGYYKCPSIPENDLKKMQSAKESAVKEMQHSEEEDIVREGEYLSSYDVPISECLEYGEYAEHLEESSSDLHDAICLLHNKISLVLSGGEMSDEVAEILEECLSEAEDVVQGYFTFGEIKRDRLSSMHREILTRLGMKDSERFIYDIERRGSGFSSHYYIHKRRECDVRWDGVTLSFTTEEGTTTFNQSHYDYLPSKEYIDKGEKRISGRYDTLIDSFEDYLAPTDNEIKMFKLIEERDYPLGYLKARCNF